MQVFKLSARSLFGLISGAFITHSGAVENPLTAKFTTASSCSSTSCHGGGSAHNESLIYERHDRHAFAAGILAKGTALRMAESLGITGDLAKATQCNVCHSPMQGVPLDRLTKDVRPDRGVSCESCHGPAENWLRFHTRRDVNFEQIVASGLRDMNSLYGRANACVACHLNLDDSLLRAGHPELHFELDRQLLDEPPHYTDARPSLGPRQWQTGQATALRELSWKLATKREEELVPRWKALHWLLRKTEAGKSPLPERGEFAAMQIAADELAKTSAKTLWTTDQVRSLLKHYVSLQAEFSDPKAEKKELRRRAEVLTPAIDRLAQNTGKASANKAFSIALEEVRILSSQGKDFNPSQFANALAKLQIAEAKDSQ